MNLMVESSDTGDEGACLYYMFFFIYFVIRCSVDMKLFPNFQHSTRGELTTNFQAFQPTDLTGCEEVNVAFSCRIAICKGTCDEV